MVLFSEFTKQTGLNTLAGQFGTAGRMFGTPDLPALPLQSTGRSCSTYWAPLILSTQSNHPTTIHSQYIHQQIQNQFNGPSPQRPTTTH